MAHESAVGVTGEVMASSSGGDARTETMEIGGGLRSGGDSVVGAVSNSVGNVVVLLYDGEQGRAHGVDVGDGVDGRLVEGGLVGGVASTTISGGGGVSGMGVVKSSNMLERLVGLMSSLCMRLCKKERGQVSLTKTLKQEMQN